MTTQPATSYAAFKRSIHVGQTLRITNTRHPHLTGDRPVTHVQGKGFTATAIRPNLTTGEPETVESWIYWPKAPFVTLNADGTLSLFDPDQAEPWLTIEVLS